MQLAVEKRDTKVKAAAIRKGGLMPAVVYGRSEESTPISVSRKDFEKLFKTAGSATVITLKGLGEEKDALIHDVEFHAVSGEPLHADFYAIEKGQTVTVSVPLEFEGVSPAVKDLGGILVKVIHEIEMEVLPKDLPNLIHVDISKLTTLDGKILVSDLKLPASAIISVPTDEVVAMIDTASDEVEESAPMDLSAIETSVERGKKEEEAPAESAE
ncbi:50S ribosomal protein L25 [Patescibacteria group bacterium]|nr:50S ribosomal protein L25 [Patescibacteria group bacterium]